MLKYDSVHGKYRQQLSHVNAAAAGSPSSITINGVEAAVFAEKEAAGIRTSCIPSPFLNRALCSLAIGSFSRDVSLFWLYS